MSARDVEVLAGLSLRAASIMAEDVRQLMNYLPPSKRSSNVQRVLDQMVQRADTIDEFRADITKAPLAARLAFAREIAGEDWAVVPRVATQAMVVAGDDAKEECIDEDYDSDADGNTHSYTTIRSDISTRIYAAMLAASEKEPGQ